MHNFWDINNHGNPSSDPVGRPFGGDTTAARSFREQISDILSQYAYSAESRYVVPSLVWNKKSKKRSSLQDPHLDWDRHHLFQEKDKRPLACIFPVEEPMYIQFWPAGPGHACVVYLEVGEIFFFDSTIVHGGVVCAGSRVHCYIAEKIVDTEPNTKYCPQGSLLSYSALYLLSLTLQP